MRAWTLFLLVLLTFPAWAQTLTLRAGWNPVAFQAGRIANLSAPGVAGAVVYDPGGYRTVAFTTDSLNSLGLTRGLWVYAQSATSASYQEAGPGAAEVSLASGWNLVAFPQSQAVADSALRVRRDGQEVPLGTALLSTFYTVAADGSTSPVKVGSGASLPAGQPVWIYANGSAQLSWSGASPGPSPSPSTGSAVQVAIFTHNEDWHHPAYPNFATDKAGYQTFRSSLLEFAREMKSRQLSWNWQSDWNFLNAVILYEVEQRDASLLAQTDGKNIVAYLRDQGVEIDPHSHENDGYNYADVAYLITRTGVTPAPVVGGHIYDSTESGYQNWPRFAAGLKGSRYPDYTFQPRLLAAAGSGSHRRDPVVTGMWRPASPTQFFTHSASGALASFGGWDGNFDRFEHLLRLHEGGALPAGPATASFMFNQWELAQPGYLQSTVLPRLDALVSLRAQGRIRVVRFEEALALWNGQGSVYPTGDDMVSFSLNTQDFAYPELSAALVTRVLDLHERLAVPLDVFLTTTQAELLPASLLERLRSSRLATVSYHFRAPKPYANNYDWAGLASRSLAEQVSIVTNYETHGLDLVTGQPTANEGGYSHLKTRLGYAPFIVGSGDPGLFPASAQVFAGMGAQLAVEHSGTVNLGRQRNGLYLRPEHVDLRLFESGYANQSGQTVLEAALAAARNASGATAPYFTGVKMHDNDFFAVDSAWLTVYVNSGRRSPPWDTSRKSPLLSDAEVAEMWTRYESMVTYAASVRARVNLVNGPVMRALQPATAAP